MQVDFYQLSRDPAEVAVAQIAAKALPAGQRMLVVAGDEALLGRIGGALWGRVRDGFLPNGMAGGEHDARQPILLARELPLDEAGKGAPNGAGVVAFADGVWRECGGFARALLFFDEGGVVPARRLWKTLGERGDVVRAFWKQEDGRWVKAA